MAALVKAFLHRCNADAGSSDEEEDDGVDLCSCEFSLAYGECFAALCLCRASIFLARPDLQRNTAMHRSYHSPCLGLAVLGCRHMFQPCLSS